MIGITPRMTDDRSFVPFGRFISALFAGLMLVIPGQTASAALCTEWVSPTHAVTGEVLIEFETLAPWSTDSEDYELRPQLVENYPFRCRSAGAGRTAPDNRSSA
jgi:hypothetical protein